MLKNLAIRTAGVALGAGMLLATSALQADAAPRRYHRGANAGAALAVGALALGVGAAIAASQRDRYYHGPAYATEPAYLGYQGYGYAPGYNYGYGEGYAQPVYPAWGYGYAQPKRYYGATGYRGGNYWQRQERNTRQYRQN